MATVLSSGVFLFSWTASQQHKLEGIPAKTDLQFMRGLHVIEIWELILVIGQSGVQFVTPRLMPPNTNWLAG